MSQEQRVALDSGRPPECKAPMGDCDRQGSQGFGSIMSLAIAAPLHACHCHSSLVAGMV